MAFLRKAGNYNLQEALSICDKKQLHRATVFSLRYKIREIYFLRKYAMHRDEREMVVWPCKLSWSN